MKKLISLLAVVCCSLSVFAGMSNSIEYSQLYIVGTAVKGGWDLSATPMSRIDRGVFTWTGMLTAGEPFKFMNSTDGWHKHIVATTKDEMIKERYTTLTSMPTGSFPICLTINSGLKKPVNMS